jgi:putative membrane protein
MTNATIGRRRLVALGAGVIALVVSTALGARAQTSRGGADAEFVTRAGELGQQLVDAGKAAVERAVSADVRAFADRMVKSHTTVNAELLSLADAPPPTAKDESEPATPRPAAVQAGVAFDRAYMEQAVTDHELLVTLFEAEAGAGKDERLKLWAGQKVATLREHLEMARALRAKVAAGSAP